MKEKVLQFVESKGTARYTDIIRFVVDTKFGEGTYDNGKGKDTDYYGRPCNPWRGYYSGAFSCVGPYPGAYFLKGKNRLVKGNDRKYFVVREN